MSERLRALGPYLSAIAIYLASRLVVLAGMAYAVHYIPRNVGDGFWDAGTAWYRYLLRWDAGWYADIVRNGYRFNGDDLVQQPVVFYPLYPMVTRAVAAVTGLDAYAALLVVANLAALGAVLLLFKLVRDDHSDRVALLTVAVLSFFPTSLFLSAGYTESLTLLLTLLCFLLLRRRRFLLASAAAGLAFATRSTGIVVLPVIAWELWRRYRAEPRRLMAMAVPCLALASAGLWVYAIYLYAAFGHPLAFMSNMKAWQYGTGIADNLPGLFTLTPFRHLLDIFRDGPTPIALDPWFFYGFVVLLAVRARALPFSLWLYAVGVLALPYVTRVGGPLAFYSMLRYMLLAFPAFLLLALEYDKRRWLAAAALGGSAVLLFVYSAAFAQWHWAG